MQIGLSIDPESTKGPTKIKSALTCPICSLMLQLPVMRCEDCGNYFCQICLTKWWSKEGVEGQCIYKCASPQLKTVKRQSIFLPMLELLQFPCQNMGCEEVLTHQTLKRHVESCQFAVVQCQHCKQYKIRRQMQQHDDICQSKLLPCSYCPNMFCRKDARTHEEQCPQKPYKCENDGCNHNVKLSELKEHQQNCSFRLLKCEWCQRGIAQKDMLDHQSMCNERKVACAGCGADILYSEHAQHTQKCQLMKVQCPVCSNVLERREINASHNLNECMIATIKELRRQNVLLRDSNIQLKLMVENLSYKFQEFQHERSKQNSRVIEQKNQQQTVLKKDLQRLNYSLDSLQKLKAEEIASHLKHPHLLGSWCLTCKQIDKKFAKLTEPLEAQRKEILCKLTLHKSL